MAHIKARYKKHRLYVYFRFSGKAFQEPTPFYCQKDGQKGCMCKQCKAAEGLALEISRKINAGTFKIGEYFPDKEEKQINIEHDVLCNQYILQWIELKKSVITYSTAKSYAYIVRTLTPYFNNIRLIDVRPTHIRNIVSQLVNNQLSPKTVRNMILMLSNVFKYAHDDGIIESNPTKNIQLPKVKIEEPDPFTHDEILKILDYMDKHHPKMTAFFAIGFYSGMRTGEIMALKWANFDFNKHKILVDATHTANKIKDSTKTGKARYVDIIPNLDKYIQKHKEHTFLQNSYLFINQYGDPFISQTSIVRHYWQPCLQRLGIRYREPYQMRHSFACMMLDVGENIKWVANMLGHTDLSMVTKRYGNWLTPSEGRAGMKFNSQNLLNATYLQPNSKEQ
ncbi:MAG: site-specific integrase [Deferribacteraceae bacterium]|jgi:integrase|nr:site-specific integrase [Deferribacteraceae bacterium]